MTAANTPNNGKRKALVDAQSENEERPKVDITHMEKPEMIHPSIRRVHDNHIYKSTHREERRHLQDCPASVARKGQAWNGKDDEKEIKETRKTSPIGGNMRTHSQENVKEKNYSFSTVQMPDESNAPFPSPDLMVSDDRLNPSLYQINDERSLELEDFTMLDTITPFHAAIAANAVGKAAAKAFLVALADKCSRHDQSSSDTNRVHPFTTAAEAAAEAYLDASGSVFESLRTGLFPPVQNQVDDNDAGHGSNQGQTANENGAKGEIREQSCGNSSPLGRVLQLNRSSVENKEDIEVSEDPRRQTNENDVGCVSVRHGARQESNLLNILAAAASDSRNTKFQNSTPDDIQRFEFEDL